MRSFLWALVGGALGLDGVPLEAQIYLDCVRATGEVSCDWRCFDNCYPGPSGFMTVDETASCLSRMNIDCVVPAVSFLILKPLSYCAFARDPNYPSYEDETSDSYLVQWPKFQLSDQLQTHSSKEPFAVSLDIAASFPSIHCQNALVDYQVQFLDQPPNQDCQYTRSPQDGLESTTSVTFGFTKMNINITKFASSLAASPSRPSLGESDLYISLSTKSGCFAPPDDLVLYYSEVLSLSSRQSGALPLITFSLLAIIQYSQA